MGSRSCRPPEVLYEAPQYRAVPRSDGFEFGGGSDHRSLRNIEALAIALEITISELMEGI